MLKVFPVLEPLAHMSMYPLFAYTYPVYLVLVCLVYQLVYFMFFIEVFHLYIKFRDLSSYFELIVINMYGAQWNGNSDFLQWNNYIFSGICRQVSKFVLD